MGLPVSQMVRVGSYIMKQKLRGRKRFPVVLMLEPLFKCNLACAGCGKIQYPKEILDKRLSPQQCFDAVEECGAPIISIPGGEPLIHPEINEIVDGLVKRRKFVYLCTNAKLIMKKIDGFTPSKYLIFSIHLDGLEAQHDAAVCENGVYKKAIDAIKALLERGFRVTTNSTFFNTDTSEHIRAFFDSAMELGVEGMMISPGYPYERAPEQGIFLEREKTKSLFKDVLSKPNEAWRFNQTPLFLDFLQGKVEYQCTPWGNPTYNIFGWQRPCYLMSEGGYATTFKELMEETQWEQYGHGNHPKCHNCMVHSGYEASAVLDSISSPAKIWRATIASL